MRASSATLRRGAVALLGFCIVLNLTGAVLYGVAYFQHASLATGNGDSFASSLAFVLACLVFAAMGALIVLRQPRNTIGWLLLVVGAFWAFALWSGSYADFGYNAHPGSLPAPVLVNAVGNWTWVPAVGLMSTFVILLFPDGRLPGRHWLWLAWTSAAVIIFLSVTFAIDPHGFDDTPLDGVHNPFAVALPAWFVASGYVVFALFPVCMIASGIAAVMRLRRSQGVERLQLKWLVTAGLFFGGFFGLMLLVSSIFPAITPQDTLSRVLNVALPLTFCTIPLAIGAAMLRYRLYEIDVVINKSLVFGTLAFFITAVYVAIVVGLGRLVGGGDRPNLVLSIAATAVVAVAFQPVRERVQRVANRLVYGERATPYEVLSDFADRVGGSYDAAELLPRMARTVAEGLGAARVEVWLASQGGLELEASWPTGAAGSPEADEESSHRVRRAEELTGDRVAEVRHQGELLGALTVVKPAGETLNVAEEKLLDDVAAQAGLVLRNVWLIEDLRSSRERLVSTADGERRRLERNLHDGAQQSLVSVALMLNTARSRLSPDLEPTLGPALDQAAEQLRLAVDELRELARGIHPVILTERGLGPAVSSLAERSPVPVQVEYRVEGRPPAQVEASLYFVVAEALTNVAKYASATSVSVTVTANATPSGGTELVLEVADDGIGGADASRGSGLRGLADRVAVVDGTLHVESPVGRGTALTCVVPLRGTQAAPAVSMVGTPSVVSR
ncbi:MAG: hypothetical protein QOK15_1560 [Nocardioidaceae bacterium]|nr:hypothetical protein [Nocardioidaceae bacterium]